MNRLSDIKATLRKNLDDNAACRELIEFIVVCFDADDTTFRWVTENFANEISTGYLRVFQSDELKQWHFGKAKNAFRNLIRGQIYASLDGDNFTGKDGGRHIIDVFEQNNYDCVFHQFQGDWGDGTCGRVSLNRDDYVTFGYDSDFLPRQWDELDAILSVLVHRRSRKYVCYRGKSIAKKSHPFKRFLNENQIELVTVEIDPKLDPLAQEHTGVAVGQHDNSYVQDDARLKYSSVFNHLSSFFKNTSDQSLRARYAAELVETQRLMSDYIEASVLVNWFLEAVRADNLVVSDNDIVLVSCIKNEAALELWQEYYRELGVTKFLLIDDFSENPIGSRTGNDTWVWRPKTGKFRYSKAFWLEILLKNFCVGSWAVCVDSDEYLDLPRHYPNSAKSSPLRELVSYATEAKVDHFCGFLLDLTPDRAAFEAISNHDIISREQFSRYQFRPSRNHSLFLTHNTVKWSYGDKSAEWAYRIDVRYRLNRAFDSLRKFPVLFVRENIHLNQGFHDLILDGQKRSAKDMLRHDLLPIRHFKLFNTQYDAIAPTNRPSNAYHDDTKVNLDRLRKNITTSLKQACISPFTFAYWGYSLIPTPASPLLRLAVSNVRSSADYSYRSIIERTTHIDVHISDCDTVFKDGALHARSLQAAVIWTCETTPFSVVVSMSDNSAELRVESESERANESLKDVKGEKNQPSFKTVIGLGKNCQVKRAILQKIWFDRKGTIENFDVNSDFFKKGEVGTHLFDWTWTRTPIKTLIHIFENNFDGVFRRQDLKITTLAHGRSEVTNSLNGLSFPHHFSRDSAGQVSESVLSSSFKDVASKIDYLASKTKNIIAQADSKILFVVYADATVSEMKSLIDVIKRKFPNLRFSILWVCNTSPTDYSDLPEEVLRLTVVADLEYPGDVLGWLKTFEGIKLEFGTTTTI